MRTSRHYAHTEAVIQEPPKLITRHGNLMPAMRFRTRAGTLFYNVLCTLLYSAIWRVRMRGARITSCTIWSAGRRSIELRVDEPLTWSTIKSMLPAGMYQ